MQHAYQIINKFDVHDWLSIMYFGIVILATNFYVKVIYMLSFYIKLVLYSIRHACNCIRKINLILWSGNIIIRKIK